MRLQERSYSTKLMRPKPQIYLDEDGSLIVITTSWGQPEHGIIAQEEIVKYVTAAKSDVEVTSPFEFLTCLTDETNYLRIALMIANDILYRGENKTGYFAAVEALALFRRGSQVAWAHVGLPHVLMRKNGSHLEPLSVITSLSADYRNENKDLHPLPSYFLGADPSCHIQCGHVRANPGDQMILLSSDQVASAIWSIQEPIDLQAATQKVINESPDSPFWLGIVQFE